ncbi:hypothetical protein D3C72_1439920 [compost metagenome]
MQGEKGEEAICHHRAGTVTAWKAITLYKHLLDISSGRTFTLERKLRNGIESYCRHRGYACHPEPGICMGYAPKDNYGAN